MDQTKQIPKRRVVRGFLFFLSVGLVNATFVVLFLMFPNAVHLGHILGVLCILYFIYVFCGGLLSLAKRESSLFELLRLISMFEACFVVIQHFFISRYTTIGLRCSDASVTHDRWDALYFSIMTWTTTGYGDLVPIGASRWVACSEALLGALYNGLVLAVVIYQLNLMAKAKSRGLII